LRRGTGDKTNLELEDGFSRYSIFRDEHGELLGSPIVEQRVGKHEGTWQIRIAQEQLYGVAANSRMVSESVLSSMSRVASPI
jgi:hypothetical protein